MEEGSYDDCIMLHQKIPRSELNISGFFLTLEYSFFAYDILEPKVEINEVPYEFLTLAKYKEQLPFTSILIGPLPSTQRKTSK